MDFVQRLRMNGIYNSPIMSPPDIGGVDFKSLANHIAGLISQSKDDDYSRAVNDEARQKMSAPSPGLGNVGSSLVSGVSNPGPYYSNPLTPLGMTPTGGIDPNKPVNYTEGMSPYQAGQLDIKRAQLQQSGDIAQGKLGIASENADTAKQRAAIYKFKAEHPGAKILTPKGGNYQLVDPITNEITDSGIPTGINSDDENAKIRGEQAIDQIDERGKQARETEGKKSEDRIAEIAKRIAGQKEVKGAPSATKPLLPNQVKTDQFNRAREFVNRNPELGKFVHIDPSTGSFTIDERTEPKYWGSPTGPTPEQQQQINDYIFGSNNNVPSNTPTPKNNDKPQSFSRDEAVKALEEAGIPQTEENIQKAMDPSNWK